MRYIRLRLRSSIYIGLTLLTFFFLLTIYLLIHSTDEFESHDKNPYPYKPSGFIPFWSALDHQNIYDIQSLQLNKKKSSTISLISSIRINELNQLVHRAHHKHSHNLFQNFTSNFQNFLRDKTQINRNKTNILIDTPDSAKDGNDKTHSTLSTTSKSFSEHDKQQLRYFLHYKLNQWKIDHQNDKIISLAEIMHDTLLQDESTRLNTTWYEYMKTVTNSHVYNPNHSIFGELLKNLQHGQILSASEMSQGTQIKVILDLANGMQGLLKPYRVPRNYQTQPDHFYFSDVERHHAEIATFHLDKILGFNRVPPVIGRYLHITHDIREKATEELAKTFFTSPANNTCFRGHCSYYCDSSHAICGKPGDDLEGSVQILLPRPPEVVWQKITHPYRRSYSSTRIAAWENNENYCYTSVLIDEDYHNRLLLDMMDLSAFDFLIGNLDRHHMMRISSFGINTALIHLDNGRSFGRYDYDDLSILSPIRQCCFFRYSTFKRLYQIYQQGLSKLLAHSLKIHEPLQMILIDEHLQGLDRRLKILFSHLDTCFQKYTVQDVMVDDGN